jgi:2-hydroxychromene-2-carboxylate isomerase
VLWGSMPSQAKSPFTPQERDLIRLEMGMRFGQYPELANGLFLRTWHSGPHQGEPKIPKAIQTMIDRGLVEIRRNPMGRQAAFFTEAGLETLWQLLRDRRAMDPERFAHLRQELGLDPRFTGNT